MKNILSFDNLVISISSIHKLTSGSAKSAVNQLLTIRNWMIGYYIIEFEQHGADRAVYGSKLLLTLADKLKIKGLDRTHLNLCRIFYQKYPQISSVITHRLKNINSQIYIPLIPGEIPQENKNKKCATLSHKFETNPDILISHLSFSHIREIMKLDVPLERFFYEFECISGTWSVQELRRQIGTNLYFRTGISKSPELLLQKIEKGDEFSMLNVKDPFALEFLGLESKQAVDESDLENALMDHLQDFLLELGKGFCFEARQKRILIDDEYFFIDLVFYHRVLHCNIIIELKDAPFSHEHLGQLNAYVAYYKENEMNTGDNPPVGILLCTKKGPKMVEYALSGMDNQLFVSTYMLQLPDREQLKEFLLKQMDEIGI